MYFHCDVVTLVTRGGGSESQATLECWRVCAPAGVRKKHHADVKPHLVAELIAFRTGSYTARLCKACADAQCTHNYPGGPWWTLAGLCARCGIEVYLNPSETCHRKRNPDAQLLCSTKCGRVPRRSARAEIRALQEAELRAEQEKAEARRKERQRTDQLINDLWPEDEAYQAKRESRC